MSCDRNVIHTCDRDLISLSEARWWHRERFAFSGNRDEGTFRARVAPEERRREREGWMHGATVHRGHGFLWENDINADARSPSPSRRYSPPTSPPVSPIRSDFHRLAGSASLSVLAGITFHVLCVPNHRFQGRIYIEGIYIEERSWSSSRSQCDLPLRQRKNFKS